MFKYLCSLITVAMLCAGCLDQSAVNTKNPESAANASNVMRNENLPELVDTDAVSEDSPQKEELKSRLDKGFVLYAHGDYEGAMREFSEALKIEPDNELARNMFRKAWDEKDKAKKKEEKPEKDVSKKSAKKEKIEVTETIQYVSAESGKNFNIILEIPYERAFWRMADYDSSAFNLTDTVTMPAYSAEVPSKISFGFYPKRTGRGSVVFEYVTLNDSKTIDRVRYIVDIAEQKIPLSESVEAMANAPEKEEFVDTFSMTGEKETFADTQEKKNTEIKPDKKPEKKIEVKIDEEEMAFQEMLKNEGIQFKLARDIEEKGLYLKAVEEYKKALNFFPKGQMKEEILYRIGENYREADVYDSAIIYYQFAITGFPKGIFNDKSQFGIAESYLSKNEYDTAIVEYLRVIAQYETSPLAGEAGFKAGNIFKDRKEYMLAELEYGRVVSKYPENRYADDSLYNIAEMYDKIYEYRDFKKATEAYGKLVQKYPKSEFAKISAERKQYIEENYLK